MTPKVLLADTTRWPNAARLAIGLAKAGCSVSAVCPTHHPLLKTSAVREILSYRGLRPLGSLVAAIETTNPDLIIPCDDRAVYHLHELYTRERRLETSRSEIATLITRSLGAPESYPIVSARYDLIKMANQEGIRVPDTAPLNTVEDLRSWHARQALPWVLKVDGTCGGRGVKIAHSPKEAEHLFLEMTRQFAAARVIKRLIVNRDSFWLRPWWNRLRPAITVQSHIRGRPANCAVVCWEGRVLAGIAVEVIDVQELTGPATIVRVIDNPEMLLSAERIAHRLRLSGFFGLDFMIEEGSGATYLIEMNPRCTPLCHLQLGKGRDMIGALWVQLSGEPFRETPPVTRNDKIAYFPQAWHCKSEVLQSSFQDVPEGEPDLVLELLRPWPDRTFLFRLHKFFTS